jgi:polyphosphate:AMP phosphotransferase
MFETLEVGKSLKKSVFNKLETPLRQQLLSAQFDLAERDYPLIIVIAGLDGAGKGALAQRLNEWMDPRGIETNTFWERSDEEESRPYFWRFWRRLPAKGQTGIFLGSWYTHPAQAAVAGDLDDNGAAAYWEQIEGFERTLTDDGALIVKLWLHISEHAQQQQLNGTAPRHQQNPRVTDRPYELHGKYLRTIEVCEQLILATDSTDSPWHLIESADRRYRDIAAGQFILKAMQARAQLAQAVPQTTASPVEPTIPQPSVLDTVDLSLHLTRKAYAAELDTYQAKLQDLSWQAYRAKRSVVGVFEGWDAAGKGSAIRRVTGAMDPRLYRLLQFAAPTDEERAHHYLWRFWRQLQRDGRATLYDRSWYGRVLVERVEKLATTGQWQRAYHEINQFEEQLVKHGCIVVKFWLHISPDEQLARFKAREEVPHKNHKITEDDWRNRERWHDYEKAVDDMVCHTSTRHAPWTLVSGNHKHYARIQILRTLCEAMESALATPA